MTAAAEGNDLLAICAVVALVAFLFGCEWGSRRNHEGNKTDDTRQ